jgi:hypothetical protein
MNRFVIAAAFLAAVGVSPAVAATEINVSNIGSILNTSVALPAEATPGSSQPFAEFFEFSLPVSETVTVSMSDSGIGNARIVGGTLSLSTHDTTGVAPLFIPGGTLIESSPIQNFLGGQAAEVNPDLLAAGAYFALITGTSGSSPINLVVDGTATATTGAVPEPTTWAMLMLGFAGMIFIGRKRIGGRIDTFAA